MEQKTLLIEKPFFKNQKSKAEFFENLSTMLEFSPKILSFYQEIDCYVVVHLYSNSFGQSQLQNLILAMTKANYKVLG